MLMTRTTRKTRMETHCRFRVQRSSNQIRSYDVSFAFVGSPAELFDDFADVVVVEDAADVEDAVDVGDAVGEGDAEDVEDAVDVGCAVDVGDAVEDGVAVVAVEDVAEARDA